MEEALMPWQDGVEGERQRDGETREADAVDGLKAAVEINNNHRVSADKQKISTLGYQRRTKQKVVTDFATVSKGTSAGAKPRAALRQVLFSQGVSEKTPPSEERGQLDALKQELETYAVPTSLKWMWREDSQGTTLEKNWTDIVHSHATMSKMQRHQQEALWEFVHTELTYINKLAVIRDLVMAALMNLHQHGFLVEVSPALLFSNLPSILTAHQLFWREVIYPMLYEVRKTGMPFDPMRLEAGCLQFHQRFSSYQHYCWEEENNLEFTRRQMESNPQFLTFVQWVETHPQCQRMRLGDMQAKPHQRITKYPLLLKAILKTTQDAHVQHTLRGMLSSVNNFLESINDYLRLKDEELALSISAQRVEGYVMEGINEEIDKHVREICHFDLTCPIRGVGPDVVRKLLLEENLKVRGRKDSKLEVVALLFSDVLLMTKVQKKGERLKVVRPPLALDRTYCIALKDGCSFVLVEVGELQTAMNVCIFAASTSESCSKWVSTICQAKETLRSWRETERKRQLENWKVQQLEAKTDVKAKSDNTDTEEQPLTQSGRQTFLDELNEEFIIPQSMNEAMASKVALEQYQQPDEVSANNNFVSHWQSHQNDKNQKPVHKSLAVSQQRVRSYEWIEMGVRRQQIGILAEEDEKMRDSVATREETFPWKHRDQRVKSAPNLGHLTHTLRYNTTGSHAPLIEGYPDVDYPMNEDSSSQPTAMSKEYPELLTAREEEARSLKTDSDSQSESQDRRRSFSYSLSEDMDMPPEPWSFSKDLKSPGVRRRRPNSSHQGSSGQTSPQFFPGSGPAWSASLGGSNGNTNKRNSVPSSQSSEHLRVLKLSSLKPSPGMYWNMHDRVSPDPQTLSEPELPEPIFCDKRPKMKTQRSASIPNIIIEGSHGLHQYSNSLYTLPQPMNTQFLTTGHDPNRCSSPLEGFLEKAKEKVKDQDGFKRNRNLKWTNLRFRYPPSSPSLSDGDRDASEEEVALMRHRALSVSKGWREQLVDGDENDKRYSVIFADGVNVDWSGWCFDDEEVMDQLHPGVNGLSEDVSRSFAWSDNKFSQQEDGECSQV
ncbi:uncharacterized protein V6R79_005508 [Siganus canaliculatus]